ncbi:MAG: hypothetical protein DLM53_02240 [Candidatus Eremiobacter antarcticus]|nr:glycosyltransferase family 9 protein [Candidatus Eremiobacteraeota bacterium]MBC5808228.1 glycosyltransferase family 9 protein [Candidatus Eremiobacteraeota bacterium]PZR63613.1 MAG: hypothetical protein DLM53_02240 [Candidatus Eremiobacter sp. RRmetagenome_bin22]
MSLTLDAALTTPQSPTADRPFGRILLIRTDRVGDLVLSTPAIASFRKSWPNAHIDAVVSAYTEPVLRHSPDVDAIHIIPKNSTRSQGRRIVARLGAQADLAVALAPRTDDLYLAGRSEARTRIGYVYRRRYLSRVMARLLLTDFCLSEADPQLADRIPHAHIEHEVRQVLALVPFAGGKRLTEELTLGLGGDDIAFAAAQAPLGAAVLTLAPRWFASNFGIDAVRELLLRLAARQAHVVVTYGADTESEAAALRGSASNITWFGGLPLLRWAAVLARAAVVISVDTGATHVAAALKVPVVVIFEREHYSLCSQEWSPWRVPSAMLCKPPAGVSPAALLDDVVAAATHLSGARELTAFS